MSEMNQAPGVQYYLSVEIKGAKYNPVNIRYLVIKEWIFNILPTIEICLIDDGYLLEQVPLEDGEDINITLAKTEDDPNPIDLTFSFDDVEYGILGDNRKSIVTFTGHLKVDDMFTIKGRCFTKQNSASVLENIAIEAWPLQFSNSHNIIPSDQMNWYQNSQTNFEFIKHILRRSYIPNDTAFFYADIENNFIYTSLQSEIDKHNVKKAKFNVANYELNVKDDSDKDDTIWFTAYSIVNSSGYFNKMLTYGYEYNYYDLENPIVKLYSDINKLDSKVSFRNKSLVGKAVTRISSIDYIASNLYGDKYYESLLRNKFLKDNFFANSLVLNINALSQVSLFDTIDIDIPSLFVENGTNNVMSGLYLVNGIQHEVSVGGIYKKKLSLGRSGMRKSSIVKQYQVEEL